MSYLKRTAVLAALMACTAVSAVHAQTPGSVGGPDPDVSALLGKSASASESTATAAQPATTPAAPVAAPTPQPVEDPYKASIPDPAKKPPVLTSDYSLPITTRNPADVATLPPLPTKQPKPKREESQIHEIIGPYDEALACVRTKLTSQDLQTSFSVGLIRDGTGQQNFVDGQGTGTFASQAAEDMMLTALTKTGVIVVDSSAMFHGQVDWLFQKASQGFLGDGNEQIIVDGKTGQPKSFGGVIPAVKGTIMPPNILIQGAIPTLDFVPGGGVEITAPITLGHLQYHIRLTMDIRGTMMPRGTQVGGQIVVSDSIGRQIDASQDEAGLSHFFGPIGAATQLAFDIGKQDREALQAIERAMLDREADVMVTKYFKITACDPQIAHGDQLAFEAR